MLKRRSAIIYEGSSLIDNEADNGCSQRLSFFNEFSYFSETSKMFGNSIKYPGVYQIFD